MLHIKPVWLQDAVVGVERAVVGLAATSGQLRTVSSDLGQAPASSSSSSVGGHPQDALDMLTASEWPGISPAHVLQTPSQCRTLWRHFVSDSELSVQQAMATQQATRVWAPAMAPHMRHCQENVPQISAPAVQVS